MQLYANICKITVNLKEVKIFKMSKEGIWESLDGGKGKENHNYIIIISKTIQRK